MTDTIPDNDTVRDVERLLTAAGVPDGIAMDDLLAAALDGKVRACRAHAAHGSRYARALGALQVAVHDTRRREGRLSGELIDGALARSFVSILDDATYDALHRLAMTGARLAPPRTGPARCPLCRCVATDELSNCAHTFHTRSAA